MTAGQTTGGQTTGGQTTGGQTTGGQTTGGQTTGGLRPIERRVLALRDQGLDPADIARRFKRGEAHVERILNWATIPRQDRISEARTEPQRGFRPIERRIIDMRAKGMSYEEIGSRFHRGAGYVRRIEDLARLRSELGLVEP